MWCFYGTAGGGPPMFYSRLFWKGCCLAACHISTVRDTFGNYTFPGPRSEILIRGIAFFFRQYQEIAGFGKMKLWAYCRSHFCQHCFFLLLMWREERNLLCGVGSDISRAEVNICQLHGPEFDPAMLSVSLVTYRTYGPNIELLGPRSLP